MNNLLHQEIFNNVFEDLLLLAEPLDDENDFSNEDKENDTNHDIKQTISQNTTVIEDNNVYLESKVSNDTLVSSKYLLNTSIGFLPYMGYTFYEVYY